MLQIRENIEMKKLKIQMTDKTFEKSFTEQVTIADAEEWAIELKMEILYWGQYPIGINKITKEYAKQYWKEILTSEDGNTIQNLYYIEAETADGTAHKYLYDTNVDMIYKIPQTGIGRYKVHSVEELNYQKQYGKKEKEPNKGTLIREESDKVTVGSISYYEPDLSGFVLENTSLVYYSEDMSSTVTISAKEYLETGKQRTRQKEGTTYELYDYENQKWANIKVVNRETNIESWWVWIPRYTYQINKENQETKIKFIDLEAEPESGYILHSDFEGDKKGIWVSKYEPIQAVNTQVGDFPYYIPDMSGFDKDRTYVEVYQEESGNFREVKLSEINNLTVFARNNTWFDYEKQIWANIKVVNPETKKESWWVWIPRYAYNITGQSTSIIFVDTNNHPLTGESLPNNYVVHSAFTNGQKGIWVSKYEPIQTVGKPETTNQVNVPDLTGYQADNTYIECYDETTQTFKEQTVRSILNTEESVINANGVIEKAVIDSSKIEGTWYRYDKQIWANIKVFNPETKKESWWVWIPRYAYNITGIETRVIYLDEEGKPTDGSTLPSNYVPHPAFNDTKTGLWASKYEPIEN